MIDDISQFFAPSRQTPPEAFNGLDTYSPLVPIGQEELKHSESGHSALYPTPELLKALNDSDNRIGFIPADFSRPDVRTDPYAPRNTEATYNQYVSGPAAEYIEKFLAEKGVKNSDIIVRVSPTSLNGGLNAAAHDIYVRDIRHVLKIGSDRYPDTTIVAAGFGVREGSPQLHEHVNNAAFSQSHSVRERLKKAGLTERTTGVFPVLFVYDRKKMTPLGGYNFKKESDDAIIKAFVLPILA